MVELPILKDRELILKTIEQKHKELLIRYQILSVSLLGIAGSFAIGYATRQIETTTPLNMIVFSLFYGFIGFVVVTLIFNNYFNKLKNKIKNIGG